MGGPPETSASDRDRRWDREKGERFPGGCGGSGASDNVIMTSSVSGSDSGFGFAFPSVATRVVEPTTSADSTGLGGPIPDSGGD